MSGGTWILSINRVMEFANDVDSRIDGRNQVNVLGGVLLVCRELRLRCCRSHALMISSRGSCVVVADINRTWQLTGIFAYPLAGKS